MVFRLVVLIGLVIAINSTLIAQDNDTFDSYFNEIKASTKKYKSLWNKDLYGPLILVDPKTRIVHSNYSDSLGIFKQNGKIYSGVLPYEINISNTAFDWNGRRWTMIMLPLSDTKMERVSLLAHELFHASQPSLGFTLSNVDNNHLDQREGRIYLRLEMEALKKCIKAKNKTELKNFLIDAFAFRTYRNSIYPGSADTENMLELNEGIAEYTGLIISDRNKNQTIEHFNNYLNSIFKNPTFVRSFAYHTIPVYGYLLRQTKPSWNQDIKYSTNLVDYFIKSFQISLPQEIKSYIEIKKDFYNGKQISTEENLREENTLKLIAEYKNKFTIQPHVDIFFEQMNVSFDPGNIMPVENLGTYYPDLRITDNWGILSVKNGALIGPNWEKVSVTTPLKIEKNNIEGEGWKLELKEGYHLRKDEISGHFKVVKV